MTRGLPSIRPRTNCGKVFWLTRPVEHLDERHGRVLVRLGQRREDRLDGARPHLLEPRHRLLRGRARRIGRRPDLGDQPVGAQVREKAHSAFPWRHFPQRMPCAPTRGARLCKRGWSGAGAGGSCAQGRKRPSPGRIGLCHSRQSWTGAVARIARIRRAATTITLSNPRRPSTMIPENTLNAVRAALEAYVDPYLGETLASAEAMREVRAAGQGDQRPRSPWAFRSGGYRTGARPPPCARTWRRRASTRPLSVDLEADIRAHAVQRNLKPLGEIKQHRRRRLRQGRGGQVDGGRESGARLGGAGRAGRHPRRRHLRAEPAAHARARRAAADARPMAST